MGRGWIIIREPWASEYMGWCFGRQIAGLVQYFFSAGELPVGSEAP